MIVHELMNQRLERSLVFTEACVSQLPAINNKSGLLYMMLLYSPGEPVQPFLPQQLLWHCRQISLRYLVRCPRRALYIETLLPGTSWWTDDKTCKVI